MTQNVDDKRIHDRHGIRNIQQTKEFLFHQQIGLQFKEENSTMLHLKHGFRVLKFEHSGKYIRNISKVLECGAGEDQFNPLCER
jgi:hypothetical protein